MARTARHLLTSRGLVLCVGLVALGAPGNPAAEILAGLPLAWPGIVVAVGLLYLGLALPSPARRVCAGLAIGFAVVVGLKLAAAETAPPLGLKATYWARATPDGPPERSTDFPWLADATRIDPSLDLSGEQFPVHFFNDAARFNFGSDVQPGRDQLPFVARWQGWLQVPSDGQRRFVVESTGPAQLTLDAVPLPDPAAELTVSAGLHALGVEYARPEARVPALRVSWQRLPGGPLAPMAGQDLRWQPTPGGAAMSAALGLMADLDMGALVVAWLGAGLVRARRGGQLGRAAIAALPLLFLGYGMLLHAPQAGQATILSGLDDWFIYESSARDILLNGPLMDGGQGHAAPFYGQPLYPYVLALAHRVTGESLFGPLVLQFAVLGLVVVGTGALARRAFGARLDGLVAVACLLALLQLEPEHFKVAHQLFNENLYMPLVMASLIVIVGLASARRPPAWWRAMLVGLLLGLTAMSRSQFLLFIPVGLLTLLVAWRSRTAPAVVALVAIVGGVVLAIAPITVRNWLVSGEVVPISSSGGASLLEFHRPPPGLIDQSALQQDPLYAALHLDTPTRTVIAFARADPRGYLATLLPLGAHSIGLRGRNDPGVYWPLFATTLLYVSSFALKRTRRLRVWPVHAFVATHLLVLMLFEADTYGYRLVVPMYAPMVAVAAQVPLALVRKLLRLRHRERSLLPDLERAGQYAVAGWALIAAVALVWQAGTLVDLWSEREPALHGLGGPAARAAATADRVGADAIYVASIDGTPRQFGAGSLPGLRYPWFKWFDPSRSVPLGSASSTAVYMLSELAGHASPGDLVACLGPPDASTEVVLTGALARQQCVGDWPASAYLSPSALFEGVASIDAVRIPPTAEAGEAVETRLLWQPLVAHPEPEQVSLQLDDPATGDGTLWGNGTLDLYPARQWDPSETIVSRVPVATEPSAIPQAYRVTVGIGPTRANAAPALAVWQGARIDRVPVGTVSLSLGSSPPGQALPADMRAMEGPALNGGGLELIGARPLAAEVAIGGPLKVGLLWRATRDAPAANQLKLRLVGPGGAVLQESTLPLLGGRVLPSALRNGNVVRDEETVLIGPGVPAGPLSVTAEMLDAQGTSLSSSAVRLGSVTTTGRAHVFDPSLGDAAAASFGSAMQLLSDRLEPAQAHANERVTIHLRWRSAAALQVPYKVFVHVLDPAGEHVVAQRDAEPQDGQAPTTSWVVGEIIDDQYVIALPADLAAGDYPIEVGVYDARSGERLRLANGDSRLLLSARLRVTQ